MSIPMHFYKKVIISIIDFMAISERKYSIAMPCSVKKHRAITFFHHNLN
jgi:hypothetical protein